jgi:hypothetical protein
MKTSVTVVSLDGSDCLFLSLAPVTAERVDRFSKVMCK